MPVTAFFGPYSPDLDGTLRTFGQASAYYDANGHYVRVNPILPDFKLGSNNTLTPTTPQAALAGLKTGQLRRCPGAATQPAADGSSPFVDDELFTLRPHGAPLMTLVVATRSPRSPLLIGAITTLIVVVAVYLSYNANNGLPFVPTLQHQGRAARGLRAAGLKPGTHRRHARGRGRSAARPWRTRRPVASPRSPA